MSKQVVKNKVKDPVLYLPVISPVLGKIIVKPFETHSRIGRAAIKSGLFFNTEREAQLFIEIFVTVSKKIRSNKDKYSHVAIEFIKKNLATPDKKLIAKAVKKS